MPRPVRFKECNTRVKGGAWDPDGRGVLDLPVCETEPVPDVTEGSVVSRWGLSLRERLSALVFGRVWLCVTGPICPPVMVSVERTPFLREG